MYVCFRLRKATACCKCRRGEKSGFRARVGINQSINLLRNKGPKATYKSQYTIYNSYRARQCITYVWNHASEKQFKLTIYVKCSCRSGWQADSADTLVTGSRSSAVLHTRITRTGDRLNWAHYDVCGTTSLRRRCRCQPTAHCNKYHVTPQTYRRSFVSVVSCAQRCGIRQTNTCRYRMVITRYFGLAVQQIFTWNGETTFRLYI